MEDKAQRLAIELFKMELPAPFHASADIVATWHRFESDLAITGEVLDTFEDEEAARIVRDFLCTWASVWSRWHPNPDFRPWYGAVAIAAEAGNWNGVNRLCEALMEAGEREQ